jgi:hypothetical protein
MPVVKKQKRAVGGSAAERGLDFQARVSAVVMAHLLVERPIGWLKDVLEDVPVELAAETGGPGDDVGFLTREGKRIEVQAKRGLQRSVHLWEALLALAQGLSANHIDAGTLVVCPNSSATIRETLAEDIVRLGTGRTDGIREIGRDFSSKLRALALEPQLVCSRIRIVVVCAVDGNRESEATASERLARIYENPPLAWTSLVEFGRQLIRVRGKGTPEQMYRHLTLGGVVLKVDNVETRAQLQTAVSTWLHDTYAQITILGIASRVSFEKCWLTLDAHLLEGDSTTDEDLDKALKRYHDYAFQHRSSEQTFQSHTIGRFINKCVVLGGPGMGKSTLLKKLALDYARDGYLVLLVKLPQVLALLTREGRRFEDSVLEVALSGSGMRPSAISLDGVILLCDELDDCGAQQPLVTAALHAFSIAHRKARIVVASRPIGYRPGEISTWRQYELQPLRDTESDEAISRLLEAVPFAGEAPRERAIALAKEQLKARSIKGAAARSPLMLSLIAALSARGIEPGGGKAALYRHLFKLIEDEPPARLVGTPPSEPERRRFLDLLGWSLLAHGNEPAAETLRRCSQWWSQDTGLGALASQAKVLACCDYWECLGIVERVRTLTQEAITFVHKTFGEFAAARYIAECQGEDQRQLIARAIQTPEWKEALSFASHLGLASLILAVWADLATTGDPTAGYSLDDAMELVVQAGIPITEGALRAFAACCWKVVLNSASRTRYTAGEALCLMSKEHWPVLRAEVLKRLDDSDHWVRLVCWACISVSPEKDVPFPELIAVLRRLGDLLPRDSHFGGRLWLRPTAAPVRQHLIVGSVRRILQKGPELEGQEVLEALLAQPNSFSVSGIAEITALFEEFGRVPPMKIEAPWTQRLALLLPTQDEANAEAAYFLEVIDDPSLAVGEVSVDEPARCWELAALLTASGLWQMPAGDTLNMSSDGALDSRRAVIAGVAKAAGLDRTKLALQSRLFRRRLLDGNAKGWLGLFDLPRVDVEVNFESAAVTINDIPTLEQAILRGGRYFSLNAGQLLYGLRDQLEFAAAIERLLANGGADSMHVIAALADCLPHEIGQALLLSRLSVGELSSGCRHLYQYLKPPFNADHVAAVCRALEGESARVAKAAAELAAQLPMDVKLADRFRTYFDEWMTKEAPYPKEGGTVPDSPREALVKVLAVSFAEDHEFMIGLAKDERSDVRSAAQKSIINAAANSVQLRKRLLQAIEFERLEAGVLRAAIEAGLYVGEEAQGVLVLLQNESVQVRYAALPILDARYISADRVRAGCEQLSTDADLDIREAASRALAKLGDAAFNA